MTYGQAPPTNGMATASLVLGIVSLCLFWAVGVGAVAGVLAIIFGVMGRNRAAMLPGRLAEGRAKAGLITGIIGTIAGVGFFILIIASVDDDGINSDPSDGWCNEDRYWQDPDC